MFLLGEDFFITASKTRRKASEAPGIVSVITAQEIKNMGARGVIVKKVNKVKVMISGHNAAELLSGSAFHFNFSEMLVV